MYTYRINLGSASESNMVDGSTFENERVAHVALIDRLEETHPGNWYPNASPFYDLIKVINLDIHQETLKYLNNAEFPGQYIFRDGTLGSYAAGYVIDLDVKPAEVIPHKKVRLPKPLAKLATFGYSTDGDREIVFDGWQIAKHLANTPDLQKAFTEDIQTVGWIKEIMDLGSEGHSGFSWGCVLAVARELITKEEYAKYLK